MVHAGVCWCKHAGCGWVGGQAQEPSGKEAYHWELAPQVRSRCCIAAARNDDDGGGRPCHNNTNEPAARGAISMEVCGGRREQLWQLVWCTCWTWQSDQTGGPRRPNSPPLPSKEPSCTPPGHAGAPGTPHHQPRSHTHTRQPHPTRRPLASPPAPHTGQSTWRAAVGTPLLLTAPPPPHRRVPPASREVGLWRIRHCPAFLDTAGLPERCPAGRWCPDDPVYCCRVIRFCHLGTTNKLPTRRLLLPLSLVAQVPLPVAACPCKVPAK